MVILSYTFLRIQCEAMPIEWAVVDPRYDMKTYTTGLLYHAAADRR